VLVQQDVHLGSPSNDRHPLYSLPSLSTSLCRHRRPRPPWWPSSVKHTVTTMGCRELGRARLWRIWRTSRGGARSAVRAMASSWTCPPRRSSRSTSAPRSPVCRVSLPRHGGQDARGVGGRHAARERPPHRAEAADCVQEAQRSVVHAPADMSRRGQSGRGWSSRPGSGRMYAHTGPTHQGGQAAV